MFIFLTKEIKSKVTNGGVFLHRVPSELCMEACLPRTERMAGSTGAAEQQLCLNHDGVSSAAMVLQSSAR